MQTRPDYCRCIKAGEDVAPISPLEQNYYYARRFRQQYRDAPKEDILKRLLELTEVCIDNKRPYYIRRQHKHRSKHHKRCFVCGEIKAYIYHHIILIKNGGYDFSPNRISICKKCHRLVHYWMNPLFKQMERNMEREQMLQGVHLKAIKEEGKY